jgi:transcriptional regulator with XRE-family HTH domain
MQASFSGAALRMARLLKGYSLEEVAVRVGKTRQYISKLEVGSGSPAGELSIALASALDVTPSFFEIELSPNPITEEQVHFRRLATTKISVRQIALAKASMMQCVVSAIENHLQLPPVRIPQIDGAATAIQ